MNDESKPAVDVQAELDALSRKGKRFQAISRLGKSGDVRALEPLLDMCREANGRERRAICRAVSRLAVEDKSRVIVATLIRKGLSSPHARVQRCAACALATMAQAARSHVEDLIPFVADDSPLDVGVRQELIAALGQIGGGSAISALGRLLHAEDDRIGTAAARALGVCAHEDAWAALRGALYDPESAPSIRVAALRALCDATDSGALAVLMRALEDDDPAIQLEAVRGLCERDEPESTAQLTRIYGGAFPDKVRDQAFKGLRQRYAQLVERVCAGEHDLLPVLVAVWRTLGRKQAREIWRALVKAGASLAPALCGLLDPSAPAADVIRILEKLDLSQAGSSQMRKACSVLIEQLDNPDRATACAAARALGTLGDERALLALASRLTFDPSLLQAKKGKARAALKRALALQQAAAIGLGRYGREALPVALEAARSENPVARRGGTMALGRIGGGRALAALDRAMRDSDEMVRKAAAAAMELAAANDVGRLERMLRSEDERTRAKAVKALGKLSDLRSLDLLLRAYGDASPRVNRAVVKALARREGERAEAMLVAAAAGGNVSAIRALEKHPSVRAIPALIEALDSPWSEVCRAALRAIRRYIDAFREDAEALSCLRACVPELTGLLYDDSARMRRLAVESLGALGVPQSSDVAMLLMDPKREVRLAAIHALGAIGGTEALVALQRYEVEAAGAKERAEVARVLGDLRGDPAHQK